MKKSIFIFMILVFVFLAGCTSPVRDDLSSYVTVKLPPITHLESSSLEEYNQITSAENFDYEDLYNALNEKIIPNYTEFLEGLKNITPSTVEVSEIHSLYLKGAEKQLEAFIQIKKGIEQSDKEIIANAGFYLQEAKNYMHEYQTKLIELAEEYDLKYRLE